MIRSTLVLALWTWTIIGTAQKKLESSILWEISSPESETKSYLLGTFYLLGATYLDNHPTITTKILRAQRVLGMYLSDSLDAVGDRSNKEAPDSPLTTFFSVEQVNAIGVQLFGSKDSFDFSELNTLNPELIEVWISKEIWRQTKYGAIYNVQQGMTTYIENLAKYNGIECLELQSQLGGYRTLFRDPISKRVSSLKDVLANQVEIQKLFISLADYYLANDAKNLEKTINSKLNARWYADMQVEKRNKIWLPTLVKGIKEKSTFIHLTAAYLYGPNGLVALLRKEGFTVTPIGIE